MKRVYILLTDTGTVFTKCIRVFTGKKYNHASLGLDLQLNQVYSFGRKKVTNPFDGGFVKENLYQDFFLQASCQVYCFEVAEEQFERLQDTVQAFGLDSAKYKYNLLGLVGIALHQHWNRKDAYFCSQFLAHVFEESQTVRFSKPIYLITPTDLIEAVQPRLVYEGTVDEYLANSATYIESPITVYGTSQKYGTSSVKKWGFPVINRFF
ncbi:hypothetical protein [Candidatus Enterococcus willemsii]|uniref:Uncharacterized protein n=1 Tax=Candidatus Enterococcus willemsii TaxID=1857215 RepID=A0ABQ6YY24_9ENTE|nr:hypothetical protein [Enterococcus sp. CU12B]KAF1302903.1 hypothetical protein BAU17_11860 [Enterococcus sp. CU12B]